jgi:uncharacterized membrane protein
MPRIELSITVDAPIDRVYEIARDVEKFPTYMDDLQSLAVLERSDDGNRTVTEWVGIVKEFAMKIKWTQEDVWDAAEHRDVFKQLKGDMDSMAGYWQFTQEGTSTKFDSVVEYEYNVPLIGSMIKSLIRKKMEVNLLRQMEAIKAQAEA